MKVYFPHSDLPPFIGLGASDQRRFSERAWVLFATEDTEGMEGIDHLLCELMMMVLDPLPFSNCLIPAPFLTVLTRPADRGLARPLRRDAEERTEPVLPVGG